MLMKLNVYVRLVGPLVIKSDSFCVVVVFCSMPSSSDDQYSSTEKIDKRYFYGPTWLSGEH